MNYSIGEFSQVARVSVKALRLYHERGLLRPDFIDPESGYRYYSVDQIYETQVIRMLKDIGFSLSEIKEVLDDCEGDEAVIDRLKRKKLELHERVQSYRRSIHEIEMLMKQERVGTTAGDDSGEVEERMIPDMLIAGHRMVGQYQEIGRGFALLGRYAGRVAIGKPMCLHFDGEYRDKDANFEAIIEVKQEVSQPEIECRALEGGQAFCVLHRGPYHRMSEAYRKLFDALKREGVTVKPPTREVYRKGPGMILKGNPEKYLTEVQFLIEEN